MANSAVVSTLGGTGEEGYRDGEGNAAQFYNPYGVAVDGDGNVIVAYTHNYPQDFTAGPGVHTGGHRQEGPSRRRGHRRSVQIPTRSGSSARGQQCHCGRHGQQSYS
eukprot:4972997-Pyramimonas_sp.AAC.1